MFVTLTTVPLMQGVGDTRDVYVSERLWTALVQFRIRVSVSFLNLRSHPDVLLEVPREWLPAVDVPFAVDRHKFCTVAPR